MEVLVVASLLDELFVCALFDDLSFVEDVDFVGVLDGGQAVGDGDGGACTHESLKGFLYESLALGVEGAGGFVKDEDGRVLEDGTGDGDALALTAAETAAAVADVCVVAVLALEDELVGIGDLGCFDDLFHRGVLDAEGYIIEEGVVEEDGFLVDVADEGAQVVEAEVLDVDAVDEDLAVGDIMVARHEIDQRALAGARLSDEGDGFAFGYDEVDAVDDLDGAVGIGEMDVAELDGLTDAFDGHGMLGFVDGILGVEDLVDALHGGETFGDLVAGLRELFHRCDDAVEDDQVEDERRGVDGRLVGEDEGAAEPQDENDDAGAEELTHGMCQGLADGDAAAGVAVLVVDGAEAGEHLVLGDEGLDDAQAAQHLV